MIEQTVVIRSLCQNFAKNCILADYLDKAEIKPITFNNLRKDGSKVIICEQENANKKGTPFYFRPVKCK